MGGWMDGWKYRKKKRCGHNPVEQHLPSMCEALGTEGGGGGAKSNKKKSFAKLTKDTKAGEINSSIHKPEVLGSTLLPTLK